MAFSRGHHLYSAGRPSRWASAHILILAFFLFLWPHYGIGQAIMFPSCGFFFLLCFFLFLAYSQPSQIGCLPFFRTWCGLSANLGCRSETWCTRIADNTGRKKSPKIRHQRAIAQLCRAIFATKARIDNRKKSVKQRYLPHMLSHCGELRASAN